MVTLVTNIARRLDDRQKVWVGAVGFVFGVACIGILGFVPLESDVVKFLVAVVGVLAIVAGTLLLGSSDAGDRVV